MKKIKENRSEQVLTRFNKSERELLEEFAEKSGGLSLSKSVQILTMKSLREVMRYLSW